MHNQVNLIGRLGKDPDNRVFESGQSITTFSLATSDGYKNQQNEWIDVTDWHNVVIRGKGAANAAKLLKKGSLVHIQGKIKTRSYDSGGEKKYVTEVVSFGFNLLEKLEPNGVSSTQTAGARAHTNFSDDDTPF